MNFATGRMYVRVLTRFLNSIHNQEPNWNDLNKLERKHMEIYIDFIFNMQKVKRTKCKEFCT